MNRSNTLVAVLTIANLMSISAAGAQSGTQGARTEGWGSDSAYSRMYNPQSLETIRGQVVRTERITPMRGMGRGLHLMVKTEAETISVHLGPNWFIENQDIQIERNAEVEVTGSRVTLDGKPAIIAAEVKQNGQVLKLRDEEGRPVWTAWSSETPGRTMMSQSMMGRGMMHQGMGGRSAMGPEIMAGRKQMMEEHSKMMSKWQSLASELDQSVARMNDATGDQKIDAMAKVINDLVDQRKQIFEHMNAMQSRMIAHMEQMQGTPELTPTGRTGEPETKTPPETTPR